MPWFWFDFWVVVLAASASVSGGGKQQRAAVHAWAAARGLTVSEGGGPWTAQLPQGDTPRAGVRLQVTGAVAGRPAAIANWEYEQKTQTKNGTSTSRHQLAVIAIWVADGFPSLALVRRRATGGPDGLIRKLMPAYEAMQRRIFGAAGERMVRLHRETLARAAEMHGEKPTGDPEFDRRFQVFTGDGRFHGLTTISDPVTRNPQAAALLTPQVVARTLQADHPWTLRDGYLVLSWPGTHQTELLDDRLAAATSLAAALAPSDDMPGG